MTYRILLTIAWVAVVSPLPAQKAPCDRLSSPEVEAITGSRTGQSQPTDMVVPAGPTRNQHIVGCIWSVPDQTGQVLFATAPVPDGVTLKKLQDENAGGVALRAQHYTEERKDFGDDASCSILSPPAGSKDGLFISSCSTITGGMLISVSFTSPKKKLTIDQSRQLLATLVSHSG